MFLKKKNDGHLVEVLSLKDLFDPFNKEIVGRLHFGEELQDPEKFGKDNLHIGSAALVPLGPECEQGMLAIGNNDSTHFHPGMSTDFLGRLGEVISVALKRHPLDSAA